MQEIDITKVDEILTRFRKEEGSLIPVLQEIQALYRYLPREAILRVSKRLKIPLVRIYGVVTFYSQFYLTPRGKHVIKSCQGTACHVRGHRKGALEVPDAGSCTMEPGGTTPDHELHPGDGRLPRDLLSRAGHDGRRGLLRATSRPSGPRTRSKKYAPGSGRRMEA